MIITLDKRRLMMPTLWLSLLLKVVWQTFHLGKKYLSFTGLICSCEDENMMLSKLLILGCIIVFMLYSYNITLSRNGPLWVRVHFQVCCERSSLTEFHVFHILGIRSVKQNLCKNYGWSKCLRFGVFINFISTIPLCW